MNLKLKQKLSKEQMIDIIDNKKINQCSKSERKQIMIFAFGSDFMRNIKDCGDPNCNYIQCESGMLNLMDEDENDGELYTF